MIKYNIKLYTLKKCIYCNALKNKLKNKLRSNDILFEEIIIDDGSKTNSVMGNRIEFYYKTETYPILEIYSPLQTRIFSFITKSDLEPRERIHIFENIDEIIIKIKQLYEI